MTSTLAILGLICGIVEGISKILSTVERIIARILAYLRTSRKRKALAEPQKVALPSSTVITARAQADFWFRVCLSLCAVLAVCFAVYALRKNGDGLRVRGALPATV